MDMGKTQYFGQLLLAFILSLQSGITPLYAQTVTDSRQGDLWSEEASVQPRQSTVQQRPRPSDTPRPQTSTISVRGPVQPDGSRDVTQIEIPRTIDGTTIPDGRQIEIELEGGRNPALNYQEIMDAFQVYREVADRRLLETFENATRATIAPAYRVLYQRWERVQATMREFPQEAFMFFWGMGAVTFFQLQWTAHKDPSAWQHFLEHQFSSVGAIGFWFFMYANRESAAIMNAAIYGRNYRDSVRMLRQQGVAHAENAALQQIQLSGNVGRSAQFFSRFVPYLSMTVGFTAQNIVSTLIGDPDFQKCAANSIRETSRSAVQWTQRQFGVQADTSTPTPTVTNGFIPEALPPAPPTYPPGQSPCEKSYNWLVVRKKIYEAAPGLVSMLGSTVISGLVEQPVYRMVGRAYTRGANTVAQLSRAAALRLMMGSTDRVAKIVLSGSVSLAISAARGGHLAILRSAQTISKLSNIILFTGIDVGGLNSFVTRRFRNVFEASHLGRRSSKMYERILFAKSSQWNDASIRPLKSEVEKFAQATSEWREAQALDAIIAHSNWMNPVLEIMNRYNASKIFYTNIVQELTKYKLQSRPGQANIDRDLGIYGMQPTVDSGGIDEYNPWSLSQNNILEYYQYTFPSVRSAFDVLKQLMESYREPIASNQRSGYEFTKQHYDRLKPLVEQITCDGMDCTIPATLDLQPIDLFVDQVSRLYYREYHNSDLSLFGYDVAFVEMIKRAYMMLSINQFQASDDENIRNYVRPNPQLNKGYWYIRAENDYNDNFKSFTQHTPFPNLVSRIPVRYPGDYFFLNMVCGPDMEKDQLITIYEGFSPSFTPPALVANKHPACGSGQYMPGSAPGGGILSSRTHPLERQNADRAYINLLEYLKQNIETKYITLAPMNPYEQTDVANRISTENLVSQWERHVYPKIEEILKLWVVKYDDVSAELLKSINDNPANWVNNIAIRQGGFLPGPFSTKIKVAATQELRMYLMLLGEIFKDLPKAQRPATTAQAPAAAAAALANEAREPQSGYGGTSPSRRTGTPSSPTVTPAVSSVPGMSYRTSESSYLHPDGWRRLMQGRYEANRVGAPLFWYLRDQDPMDFATIAYGFETEQNRQRLTPNNNTLRFQALALSAFKDVTDLFSRYEVQSIGRSNPSACWVFLNQSFMCRQWNALKDVFGMRSENMYHVKANVSKEEEEAKLKAFDDTMTQIETALNTLLSSESGNVRLSNDQKLFIEDLVKRSKAIGEAMKHLLSMLRMNEIGAQINGQSQGREQIQGPNGGSLMPGR